MAAGFVHLHLGALKLVELLAYGGLCERQGGGELVSYGQALLSLCTLALHTMHSNPNTEAPLTPGISLLAR